MSLQVWLPLNGNANNYGISDFKITNATAVVDTNGKIGSCYKFSSQVLYGPLNVASIFNTNKFTGAAWTYLTTTSSASYIYHLGGVSAYPNLFGLDQDNGTYRIFLYGNEIQTTIATILNQWVHLAVTYNGTTLILFINGEQVWSQNVAISSFTPGNHLAIGARIANAQGTSFAYNMVNDSKLNDIRLYNNCLTAEEVKKIAQGLVLHYPLNNAPLSNLHSRPSILPPEYQEVEYIESTGTQAINLNLSDLGTVDYEGYLNYQFTALTEYCTILGSHYYDLLIRRNNNTTSLQGYVRGTGTTLNKTDAADLLQHRIYFKATSSLNTVIFDGVTATSSGATVTQSLTANATDTVYLFGTWVSYLQYLASARVYSFWFKKNNELIRYMIPCYRKADNKPGMYDLVNNEFYTNTGSGEFICGPVVKALPKEYMSVDYLTGGNALTAYINTGIKILDTHKLEFKVAYNSGTTGWSAPFASYSAEANYTTRLTFYNSSTTTLSAWFLHRANTGGDSFNFSMRAGEVLEGIMDYNSLLLKNLTTNSSIHKSLTHTTANADTGTLRLFSYTSNSKALFDIYKFIIYNNNIPIRQFIPCLRISDKKPGMYDLVNDVFYINEGSGEFIYSLQNIEYDISSFSKNLTKHGSTITSVESNRYPVALSLTANDWLSAESLPAETKTITFWYKGNPTTVNHILFIDKDSGLALGFYSNGEKFITNTFSNALKIISNWKNNDWNFITLIKTSSVTNIYINTQLCQIDTTNTDNWDLAGTSGLQINGRGNTTSDSRPMIISDFRAYSTELSVDEIQELYNMGRLS